MNAWLFVWLLSLSYSVSSSAFSVESNKSSSLRFFVGGLGYCGSRLAERLRHEFPSAVISGCVRSQTRKQVLLADPSIQKSKIQVHVLDLDENYVGLDDAGLADLSSATHVVQTIAPIADFDRDPLLALHTPTLQESQDLQWVGYLSSTGVYGDHDGNWVDEASELRCADAKSLARVQAEGEWRQLEDARQLAHQSSRIDCFRCGGIYGPGRGPLFSALAASSRSTASSEEGPSSGDEVPKYVNRILVDDICGAVVAAVRRNSGSNLGGKIYNLVDDDPAPRRQVMTEARSLVGNTPALTEDGSSGKAPSRRRPISRFTGNKRCRNQSLKNDYGWELVAPTYREGLALLLRQTSR